MIPGLVILELILKIVHTAMEGQSVEQRQQMWAWYIEDVKWWRRVLKLDKEQP